MCRAVSGTLPGVSRLRFFADGGFSPRREKPTDLKSGRFRYWLLEGPPNQGWRATNIEAFGLAPPQTVLLFCFAGTRHIWCRFRWMMGMSG